MATFIIHALGIIIFAAVVFTLMMASCIDLVTCKDAPDTRSSSAEGVYRLGNR